MLNALTQASHDLLIKWLTEWRNPHRISNGLPSGATLAHKTETMPGVMNDVGVITSADGRHHIALVVFTKNAKSKKALHGRRPSPRSPRAVYDDFTR